MSYASPLILALFLALIAPGAAHAQFFGNDFQVNSYTTGDQSHADVAADADGDFVVAWRGETYYGYAIFGRRYNSAGQPQGTDFQISVTTNDTAYPALAAADDGDFVVVWVEAVPGSDEIFGRRYSSAGIPQGSVFQVNSYTTGLQKAPDVSADAEGDFVVVWTSPDGSYDGISAQRYTSAGVAQGGEFQVNTYTTDLQGFRGAAVAAADDGDFMVAWSSPEQDGSYVGIFGRRYSSAGVAQGGEFQVNTYTTQSQVYPGVAADAQGDFVVVWLDYETLSVVGRRYSSAGVPQSGEFQVNSSPTALPYPPAVAADGDGNFVVVWRGYDNEYDIFARAYSSAGEAQGGEFRVNSYTTGDQISPAVTADGAADFVVVWQSGNVYDVVGRRLQEDGDGIPVGTDDCPEEANPDLLDSDGDGTGDVCDPCPLLNPNSCNPNRSGGTSLGSTGGTFTTPDGSITVAVPAGALSSGTSISVTENANGFVVDPEGSFLALYKVGLGPVGQHFTPPVTVTFRWNDRDSDGVVDRGTCQGGSAVGLSCDANVMCPGSTCSVVTNPLEGNLVLKRNAQRFSKNGFGATTTQALCSSHQTGGGCELAVANCADAAGTGMATVANCCDTVNNRWVFQTCDFSEFSVGDLETLAVPAFSSAGCIVLMVLLALGLAIPAHCRWKRSLG
jgi:hypothetical protein